MSQEIVFTSAERGLRSGSTGFCTVRSTAGMPANTASVLEQLTGYTHAFDAYDRNVMDRHPVNYAHYITQVAGQRLHILGRISNAPLDHTNRSNKLAHLLAIDDDEIDLARTRGPAAVIEQRIASRGKQLDSKDAQFWMTEWSSDREPVVLPDSKTYQVPAERDAPVLCNTWKQVLGDAGWAATLADSIHDRKRKTVPIVFSVEQKDLCLALVTEALSLLPPEERWDVTFSTFYSGSLPTKVECRWQFLLDSTDLAKKALRTAHRNPVIDLTSLRGTPAEPNELTPFVLSKDRPWLSTSRKRPEQRIPRNPGFRPPREQDDFDAASSDADAESDGNYSLGGDYDSYSSKRRPGSPDRQTNWMSKVVIGCAVLLFILCGIILLPGSSSKPTDEFSQLAQADQAMSAKQREEELVQQRIAQRQKERAPEPPKRREQPVETPAPTEPVKPEPPVRETIAAVTPKKQEPPEPKEALPVPEHLPFDFIRKNLEGRLSVSKPQPGEGRSAVQLATVFVGSAQDCELRIRGSEAVLEKGFSFQVATEDLGTGSESTRRWTVSVVSEKSKLIRPEQVAKFELKQGMLSFQWLPRHESFHLARAEVELSATNPKGDDHIICSLLKPRYHEVATLPDGASREIKLLDNSEFEQVNGFVLECNIDGLPDYYEGGHHKSLTVRPADASSQATAGQPSNGPAFALVSRGKTKVEGQALSLLDSELTVERNAHDDLVLNISKYIEVPRWDERQNKWYTTRELFRPSVFEDLKDQARKKGPEVLTEFRKAKTVVEEVEKQVAEIQKLTSSKDEKKRTDAMRALPGYQQALTRARTSLAIAENKKWFIENAAQWHELVSDDLGRLRNSVKIRYELKQGSSSSKGVTLPIVATKE